MNTPFLLFMDVGAGEMLLVLIAVLLLFGPKKIPELARKIGKGMYELNKAKQGIKEEFEREADSSDKENRTEHKDENIG
jgi:sec-independent protein translocase protein TatA